MHQTTNMHIPAPAPALQVEVKDVVYLIQPEVAYKLAYMAVKSTGARPEPLTICTDSNAAMQAVCKATSVDQLSTHNTHV